MQSSIEELAVVKVQLDGLLEPLKEAVLGMRRQMENNLKMIGEAFGQMHLQIAEVFAAPFKEFLERARRELPAYKALKSVDLFIAPSMDDALLARILSYHKSHKNRNISIAVTRYYQERDYERLQSTVKRWKRNSLFAPRMGIFTVALKAHTRHEYELTIPSLLPQIEGLIADFASIRKNELNPFKVKNMIKILNTEIACGFGGYIMLNGIIEYIDDVLYQTKHFEIIKSNRKQKMNRHLILHGRQKDYCYNIDSLRLFLLLDVLSVMLYVEDEKSKNETKINSKMKQDKRI